MKKRHLKTIGEKFLSNGKYKNKDDIIKLSQELNYSIKDYIEYRLKKDIKISVEQILQDNNIFHLGKFFLRTTEYNEKLKTLYRGGDAYSFNSDDEFCETKKLKGSENFKDSGDFQEYWVMGVSDNGCALIWYNYPKTPYYDNIIRKDEILLEGNIGKYIK